MGCGKDKRGRNGETGVSDGRAEGLASAVRGCWGPQQQERLAPGTEEPLLTSWDGACALSALPAEGRRGARTPWRPQRRGAAGSDLEDPVKGCHLTVRFTF